MYRKFNSIMYEFELIFHIKWKMFGFSQNDTLAEKRWEIPQKHNKIMARTRVRKVFVLLLNCFLTVFFPRVVVVGGVWKSFGLWVRDFSRVLKLVEQIKQITYWEFKKKTLKFYFYWNILSRIRDYPVFLVYLLAIIFSSLFCYFILLTFRNMSLKFSISFAVKFWI